MVVPTAPPDAPAEEAKPVKHSGTVQPTPDTSAEKPVFKLQILTHHKKLPSGSPLFKGLKGVESYREGKVYKYTYKSSANISDIRAEQKKIKSKFPEAFIVAFIDGQRVSVQEALKQ